ncbi:BREX-1 system phosphatase PglZ type A [Glaciimonas sp. CA11.2]|uniref:BREX-1 system phosphatase PglZ type A n=1 Tax=Glaciimonas sp. CA11.2 TaxID=3048601 RepID=UPI002AB55C88|nr:BREX-1 system phosphatase PglZ type A [Glaciimonas sp. CA11.2]MDY7545497.1 BREX-1 system phosphatase PglZ type A [Glaciimonas sp. CA11.2]MEB0163000.1 BREX-1 system phosphatase PglZ type A [Glaciimonas sp. CA11.2]
MSTSRIAESLNTLFTQQPIVFWNDADAEFASQVDQLDLPDVQLIRLDQTPALQAKLMIERETGDKRWLIYAPNEEPEAAQDWLLDVRLRGKPFRADSTSILLEELGLASHALRDHLKLRGKFLRAKDRIERLKRWVEPHDSADDIDRKMMAVVTRAENAEAASIFLKVFSALVSEGSGDLGALPKPLAEIGINELEEAFWILAERKFGYCDATPSLRGLLFAIFASDFSQGIGVVPAQLSHFLISNRAKAASASVFVSRWRSDMANYGSYDALSNQVSDELRIMDILGPMNADRLADAMTFEAIEKRIIADLKGRIIVGHGANMDSVRTLIARRRDGHWANMLLAGANDSTRALSASYDALEAAAGFFELQAKYAKGFSFANAKEAFTAYASEIHRFDQLYRWFMKAAESVEPMGWSLLHELRDRMEDAYSGWFLSQLTSAWGSVIEGTFGLLAKWRLDGVVNQQDFYTRYVAPAFNGGAKRVFVVISDAFRYEAAAELVGELNTRSRMKASVETMLGVLPSYTSLGMASLLPHERLAYKTNTNLDVLVDGQSSSTVEQRSSILAAHGGVAIKREELMEKGRENGREFVKPHKLVYVYHDLIDMIGDKQGSETQTFDATARAIKELSDLVGFIVNNLNGSTVFITADHGFLYQESAMDESNRSALDEKPDGAIKSKKRYIIGRNLGSSSKAWSGNTADTAGTDVGEGSMDFLVPKGTGRFHFAGGARFVHGSAMPQEIVIPVIAVKESESEMAKTKTVEVSLLGSSNKVVTNKQRFEFIQTEAVSERVLPVTLLVSIRDGEKLVSDEQAVTFDSTSQMLDDRKRSVMLTIGAGSYDRAQDYFLVARDAKTKAEAWRAALKIDLAFSNDF